jgi:hypothetical protein
MSLVSKVYFNVLEKFHERSASGDSDDPEI